MNDAERKAKFAERLSEERGSSDVCLWMSFCDPRKPAGSQFLGVIITRAPGIAHAIQRTHALGINPGGHVMSYVTDDDDIRPQDFDRLLVKDELVSLGYCDE